MRTLHRFISANRRLAERFDKRADAALYAKYDTLVSEALDHLPAGAVVVDIGGGRTMSFADRLPPDKSFRLIAVDISPEQLASNTIATDKVIADVSVAIPLPTGSADLVVSRTVLEHLPNVSTAVQEMARILKPGGRTIHLLPCRYALFAVIARLIPFPLAKRILHFTIPESRGVVEFDVYYDRAHPSALEHIFRSAGFRHISLDITWAQSAYFHSFVPAFALVWAYQSIVERLHLRRFASYVLVSATI